MTKREDYYGDYIHLTSYDDHRSLVIDLFDVPPVLRKAVFLCFRDYSVLLNHKLPDYVKADCFYGRKK